jgi:transposase
VDYTGGLCGPMRPSWTACTPIDTATSPPNIAGAGLSRTRRTTTRKDRHHERDKSSNRCYGWVLEQTFGWLSRNRRMSKDYERKVQTSETLIEVAMIRLLLARLGRGR